MKWNHNTHCSKLSLLVVLPTVVIWLKFSGVSLSHTHTLKHTHLLSGVQAEYKARCGVSETSLYR